MNPRPTGPKPVALPNCATPRRARIHKRLVGVAGFEPAAHWSQTSCATKLRYTPIIIIIGRGRRTRTLDTRFWRPLLYQLSYTPTKMAEKMGFEPMLPLSNTNGLANRPLQPLEYFSIGFLAERVGFEPTVPCGITGFQDRLLKPLGHLSVLWNKVYW